MSINENRKNIVIVKSFQLEDSRKLRFLVGKDGVGVQLSEDEAFYVVNILALLLGYTLKDRNKEIEQSKKKEQEYKDSYEVVENELFNAGYKDVHC